MNSLHICYVGPAASITLRRWVKWFGARGHDVTVITVEPAELSLQAFRQINVNMPRWPHTIGRLLSAVRMAIAVRRLKPDVVHFHYLRGLAWGGPLTGYHPCVVTPWGSDVLEEQGAFRDWYSRKLTCRVLERADLVTVHSAYMEQRVRGLLPDTAPMARIGRGVNLEVFRPGWDVRPLRQRWHIGEDCRVIFSPRLAQPFYYHERVIRAIPAVSEKYSAVLLVIAEQFADPAYVADLRRLAKDLGVADRVKFVGAIPYHEMPLWLNLSEAVVMMPRSDGMPNTLLEAMACGTVPVLTRLPQYAELIKHGVNGFLVDPDEGDLAGPLISVLSNVGLREHISQQNRDTITREADQNREMSKMENWYEQLVAG